MNKKLLIGTALASVAFAGSAMADLTLSANTEVTLRSFSKDTSNVDGATELGQETNLVFKGGKDLDNGMTLSLGGNLESDSAGDMREVSMVASNDSMYLGYGRDHGAGVDLDGSVAPHVGDQNDTLAQSTVAFSSAYVDVNSGDHLKLGFNVLGGKFDLKYSPDLGSSDNDAGAPAETAGSATQIAYQGNLGIEGLNVQAGIAKEDDDKSTTTGEKEYSKFGASYTMGQISIGGDIQDYEHDLTSTASVGTGNQAMRGNITFAASDNLAIGVSYTETQQSYGSGASNYLTNAEEEITAVTVGYNIAGMGFNFSYAEIENLANVSGSDATAWQIQTKQSF
jgi:hypothetical protein